MTNYIFIDTIIQVFESDGNLHIVGGLSNGQIDINGKDLIDKNLHLTIPISKALKILPEIAESLPKILPVEIDSTSEGKESLNKNHIEGLGLHFNI